MSKNKIKEMKTLPFVFASKGTSSLDEDDYFGFCAAVHAYSATSMTFGRYRATHESKLRELFHSSNDILIEKGFMEADGTPIRLDLQ